MVTSFISAENYEVKMVNADASGQVMIFDPPFLKANVGDTVTFLPTDMLHNSQSVPGLVPSSANAWNGAMNEKITIKLNGHISNRLIFVYFQRPNRYTPFKNSSRS